MAKRRSPRTVSACETGRLLLCGLAAWACLGTAAGLADDDRKTVPENQLLQADGIEEPAEDQKKAAQQKKALQQKDQDKAQQKKGKAQPQEKKKIEVADGYADAPVANDPPTAPAEAVADEVREAVLEVAREAVAGEVREAVADDFAAILEQDVDANVANVERQFAPKFKSLMTAELSFINRACELDLAQRKKIKATSDRCLKAALRKYAMTQQRMMQGGWGRRNTPSMPDPTDLVHQTLARTLAATLAPGQKKRYDQEIAERKASRKRVTVENVVVIIDDRLVLSVEQRKELTELLSKNWKDTWVQSVEMLLLRNNQYLPKIPDRFVTHVLNETQKRVWRTSQKRIHMHWGGFGWNMQVGALDDFPLDEPAAADKPE